MPRRRGHLPINPSPAHPDTGELLYLKRGMQLWKESYIKTKKFSVSKSLIDFGFRERETGKKYQLRSGSLAIVNEAVDANINILDGMASKSPVSGALSKTSTNQIPVSVHESFLDHGSTRESISNMNENSRIQVPVRVHNNIPYYGSSRQNIPKIPRPVEPPVRIWPREPLPSNRSRIYPDYGTRSSSDVERLYVGQQPLDERLITFGILPERNPQRITSGTSPLLPVHARSGSHRTSSETSPLLPVHAQPPADQSSWSETLGLCFVFLILVLFGAFICYMAYWIHRWGGWYALLSLVFICFMACWIFGWGPCTHGLED